jgi:hypothetical protein
MDKLRLASPEQAQYVSFFKKSLPFFEKLDNWEATVAPTFDFGQLAGMLEKGLADFFVYPLEMVPYSRSGEIVVSALAGRMEPGWTLLVHQDFHDAGKLLQIPSGGELVAPIQTAAKWLKEIRPDVKYTVMAEPASFFTGEQLDKTRAWLLPTYLVKANASALPYWLDRDILPEELPGLAGQGTIALVTTRDNILVRRRLNQIHQRNLVAYSNAERGVDRDLGAPVSHSFLVYCKKAENRPFELFFKMVDKQNTLQSYHLSSGTHLNLQKELEGMMEG